ncbi:hypothetical protein LXL04_004515 [Taraxacum kok-saghyz]
MGGVVSGSCRVKTLNGLKHENPNTTRLINGLKQLTLDLAIRVIVSCIRVRHEFTRHEFGKHEHDTNFNSCLKKAEIVTYGGVRSHKLGKRRSYGGLLKQKLYRLPRWREPLDPDTGRKTVKHMEEVSQKTGTTTVKIGRRSGGFAKMVKNGRRSGAGRTKIRCERMKVKRQKIGSRSNEPTRAKKAARKLAKTSQV